MRRFPLRHHLVPAPDQRDDGSAIIEFSILSVVLMIPLVYIVLSVFAVQNAAYAVTAATREAGRAFATTPPGGDPQSRALAAARIAMADHGLDLAPDQLRIVACSANPCLTPGASVTFRVDLDVALPFVPAVLGTSPASIGVDASHVALLDRYRLAG
jgi:Flp pilus assembly protein TadG